MTGFKEKYELVVSFRDKNGVGTKDVSQGRFDSPLAATERFDELRKSAEVESGKDSIAGVTIMRVLEVEQ